MEPDPMRKFLLTVVAAGVLLAASPLQTEPAMAVAFPPRPPVPTEPTILGVDQTTALVVLGIGAGVLTGGVALGYVAAGSTLAVAARTAYLAVDYVSNAAFVTAVTQSGFALLGESYTW
jgi:hypothetical protein